MAFELQKNLRCGKSRIWEKEKGAHQPTSPIDSVLSLPTCLKAGWPTKVQPLASDGAQACRAPQAVLMMQPGLFENWQVEF